MQRARLDRTLIAVSGPDARPFLQELVTQDVERLDAAPVIYAALLTPQGKLSADMFLWARADRSVLIDADPTRGGDLLRRLSMYKLRSAVTLEDMSAHAALLVADAPFDGASPDPRLAALGWRTLVETSSEPPTRPDWYAERRIAAGVPDLVADAGADEVFASEALLEELNGVDFKKGCFVGQENVSRMKRRATTRRKFCPIAFEGPPPAPGTPIRAGAAELGSVRTGVAGRALALLRLDRALGAQAPLLAGELPVRLDPPGWLILPPREGAAD